MGVRGRDLLEFTIILFYFVADKFVIKSKSFERTYEPDGALFDYPENVIWPPKEKNETCLHDLQTLVSNGLTNFIKSILIDKKELEMVHYKVKEPMKMEDFRLSKNTNLYDVSMSGFPALNAKESVRNVASVDAEELKRFQVCPFNKNEYFNVY